MRIALLAPEGDQRAEAVASLFMSRRDDVTVLSGSRLPLPSVKRFYEDDLDLLPSLIWHLRRGGFDLACAFTPACGWAAAQATRLGGPPFVYSFSGPLTRQWLVDRHYRLEMMLATARAAEACVVEDADTAEAFRRYLLRDPEVVELKAPLERYEAVYRPPT